MKKLFIIATSCLILSSCGSGNIDYVKTKAGVKWNSVGFNTIGYEGFQWSFGINSYGRGTAWYTLNKVPDNGITYTGALERWGDEIHIYNIRAVDAIKP